MAGIDDMRRLVVRTAWVSLLVVLTGMTYRLLWLASQTQTGLELLGAQWRDATVGLVAGRRTPVVSRPAVELAAFWLEEADRVLSAQPDSAELAAGAAVALDGPTWGFTSKYFWNVHLFDGHLWFPSGDEEDSERAFESCCKERCLNLTVAATTLDPSNVEWWQLRALLLLRNPYLFPDGTPRDARWVEILEECARHDPDNALYDYLAAFFYWESSEPESPWEKDRLKVADAEQFARGVKCFERGQTKRSVTVGDGGCSALVEFLTHTRLPKTQYVHVHYTPWIYFRWRMLPQELCGWQAMRADEEEAAGRLSSALAIRRQSLRLIDQYVSVNLSTACSDVAMDLRVTTTGHMRSLAEKLADSLSPEELASIAGLEENARLDREVVREADRLRWLEQAADRAARGDCDWLFGYSSHAMVIARVAVGMLPSLALVLLLIGVTARLLSRLARQQALPRIGPLGHAVAVAAACAITVVVFGLAPAEIISPEVQAWVLTLLLILAPLVVVVRIAWRWLRRHEFKFSLRTMLVSTSALCVLLALVSITGFDVESFHTFPFELSIPGRGWEGLSVSQLYDTVFWSRGDGIRTLFQWIAYGGQYFTVALWAGFAAVLLRRKARRSPRKTGGEPFRLSDRLGALCRSINRPLLVCAALALLIYLALAPRVMERAVTYYSGRVVRDHWPAFSRRSVCRHVHVNRILTPAPCTAWAVWTAWRGPRIHPRPTRRPRMWRGSPAGCRPASSPVPPSAA